MTVTDIYIYKNYVANIQQNELNWNSWSKNKLYKYQVNMFSVNYLPTHRCTDLYIYSLHVYNGPSFPFSNNVLNNIWKSSQRSSSSSRLLLVVTFPGVCPKAKCSHWKAEERLCRKNPQILLTDGADLHAQRSILSTLLLQSVSAPSWAKERFPHVTN